MTKMFDCYSMHIMQSDRKSMSRSLDFCASYFATRFGLFFNLEGEKNFTLKRIRRIEMTLNGLFCRVYYIEIPLESLFEWSQLQTMEM